MAKGFPSLSSADSLHGGSRETLLFDNPAYLYSVTRPHARDGRDYFLHIIVADALLFHITEFMHNVLRQKIIYVIFVHRIHISIKQQIDFKNKNK